MSRGIMFHVVTNPANLGGIDESDFYDYLGSLGVDYVQNQAPEDALAATEKLRARLMAAGFAMEAVAPDEDWSGEAAFAFSSGSQEAMDLAKQAWFHDGLAALKRKVAAIDLDTYATDTGPVYDLRQLLEDTDGDAVYLDMGTGPATYTLDRFVRCLAPDTVYYIDAATVYMH